MASFSTSFSIPLAFILVISYNLGTGIFNPSI
nr:MAG TPA: hypothetical protein [Caudoviricetes sp.]